jgi:tetratricopeptide (TPR) repeat protein
MNLDVAEAMLKLAPVLNKEEVFDEAERLADRAIATRTALLGNDNIQTLEAMYVKAEDWAFGDRRLDAAKLLCELLPRAIQIEGSDQTDLVLQIKGILGYCGGCNNTPEDGLKYLQETLDSQRNRYGPDDDRINRTLINLGAMYQTLREPTKAEALLTEAADRRRRVLGNDHPMLGTALFNLAGAVNTTRGASAAEPISREALSILERRLVPGHYEIVRTRGQLGSITLALKRYDEAEVLFRQTLQESHDRPGKYEAKARTVRRLLGACLFRSKRFEEAEAVLTDALQRVVPTKDTAEIQKIAAVFAQLYKAWSKPDLESQWRARQADATLPLPNQQTPD